MTTVQPTPEESKVIDHRVTMRQAIQILSKNHADLVKKEIELLGAAEAYTKSEDVLEIENAISLIEKDLTAGALQRAQKAFREAMDQAKLDLVNKVVNEAQDASQQDFLGEITPA